MFFDVPKTCNEKGKKEKASTGNFGIVFRNYLNHLRHLAFVYVYRFTIGKKMFRYHIDAYGKVCNSTCCE